MFGFSAEHLLILAIILVIFGPRRLPELGNTVGKAIRNFKDGLNGVEEASYRHLDPEKTAVNGPDSKATKSDAPNQQRESKTSSS